jgi:cysteine desulfurase
MNLANYFDHAATSPVDPRVREAMLPWLGDGVGNANSLHQPGRAARAAVEAARAQVAEALGAEDPMQIIFTSGATEANNWLVACADDLWISPFEHSSLREPALGSGGGILPNQGFTVSDPDGTPQWRAVMRVHNETGAILDPWAGTAQLRFSDLTQAVGKIPVSVAGLDAASCSAHKCGGPMGVGVMFLAEPDRWVPLLTGGGQEFGLRSGTLNVAGIVGAGLAFALAAQEQSTRYGHAEWLRDLLRQTLAPIDGVNWNENGEGQSPFIASLTIAGILAETLVVELDHAGFAVSAGAACSSEGSTASPGLMALGMTEREALCTLRISFGPGNTADSTRDLADHLLRIIRHLRRDSGA